MDTYELIQANLSERLKHIIESRTHNPYVSYGPIEMYDYYEMVTLTLKQALALSEEVAEALKNTEKEG